MAYHVDVDEFERIAAAALDAIPAPLRARLEEDNLMITIQPAATGEDRVGGIDRHVLGYFEGGADSTFDSHGYPKRIVLFQGHIERICGSHADLVAQVTDTVLHEVAHYFGMSHADIRDTRLRH